VNGPIEIDADAVVSDSVETVNGSIRIGAGSKVERDVASINGSIVLRGTKVGRDVRTINGGVHLDEGTVVQGDVIIEDKSVSLGRGRHVLEITLSGGSVVQGDIINESDDVDVEIRLEGESKILGRVTGAKVIEGGAAQRGDDPATSSR